METIFEDILEDKKNGVKKTKNQDRDMKNYRQIWGIIYLAGALYLAIALINGIFAPHNPLFGKILGTNLSFGMRALFGIYTQFLFVVFLAYTGVTWLRNIDLTPRKLISFFMLLVFICTAFAIPLLPIIRISPSIPGGNLLGCVIAKYVIYPVFGDAVFGAYFALFVGMFVTAVYMTKLDLIKLSKTVWTFAKELWRRLKPQLEKLLKKTMEEYRKIKAKILKSSETSESQDYNFPDPQILQIPDNPNVQAQENQSYETYSPQNLQEGQEPHLQYAQTVAQYGEISQEGLAASTLPQNYAATALEGYAQSTQINAQNPQTQISRENPISPETDENVNSGALAVAYIRPSPSILPNFTIAGQSDNKRKNDEISSQLIEILEEFNIKDCRVVEVNPGPIVTLFEIEPGKGVKISAFEGLEKDIGIKIGGKSVRIDTIPNKTTIGIEVPNEKRETVYFKEILMSPAFQNSNMKLPVVIGKGTTGQPLVEDIAKMPHILIAGQTGSGKSVGINSFIASLLFSKTPDELRLIMIDPKKVEMACYEDIPHLLMPVVTEVENAVKVLECAVTEMMARYDLLKKVGSKNLDSFNEKVANRELEKLVAKGDLSESENKKMCYIVVIIDELADLMMTAGKEVEKHIQRIAQLARAVGIHLIVATQRPDTKVVTGNIKANLPSRIAFRVMSYIDSRTIIDHKGAEQLLGNGDMLYLKNGAPKIIRYHGAFISEKDVENLVDEIKRQGYKCENLPSFEIKEDYGYGDNDISYKDDKAYKGGGDYGSGEGIARAYSSADRKRYGNRDEMFEEAARLIVISKLGSTSSIQRHLNLGYARAGRVMDELAAAGIVGQQELQGKPRKVLVSENELEEILKSLSEE